MSEKSSDVMTSHEEDARHSSKTKSTSASHPSRSRRKISMPWFRQSSFGMSLARLRLPKQHTIATEVLPDDDDGQIKNSGSERDAAVSLVSLKEFILKLSPKSYSY